MRRAQTSGLCLLLALLVAWSALAPHHVTVDMQPTPNTETRPQP